MQRFSLLLLCASAVVILLCPAAHATTFTVTSNLDPDPDPKQLTLRQAIALAQNGDTINFASSVAGQTISLDPNAGSLRVSKSITITDAGQPSIILDAHGGAFAILIIEPISVDVVLENLVITGSNANYALHSGDIPAGPNLVLNNCIIRKNHRWGLGGFYSHISMNDCEVSHNTKGGIMSMVHGPGINSLHLNNCIVSRNTGEGIHSHASHLTVLNSQIYENRTEGPGAGIYFFAPGVDQRSLELSNCTISDNAGWTSLTIDTSGANKVANCTIINNKHTSYVHPFPANVDLRISRNKLTLTDCIIKNNAGMGISSSSYFGGTAILRNCSISGHQSSGIINFGNLEIDRCQITNNGGATGIYDNGGGIQNLGNELTVNESTISGNRAPRGGALYAAHGVFGSGVPPMNVSFNNCIVCHNTATQTDGGAMVAYERGFGSLHLNVTRSTLTNCTARSYGGAISCINENSGVFLNLDNSTISSNDSGGNGGGIYFAGGPSTSMLNLRASTVTLNSAGKSAQGGGVFVRPMSNTTTYLKNTIVANNTNPSTPDISGSILSQGYNLIGRADGSDGWVDTDLIGYISNPINPMLGPLANNGGITRTHALLAGSPAIKAGDPALAGTPDQRGVTRGNPPSIGSYEYVGGGPSPDTYR